MHARLWIAWKSWLAMFLLLGFLSPYALAQQVPNTNWWSAIRRDDVSDVKSMLLRRVDPNVLGPMGNPALTQAAREQSWRVFDTLLFAPNIQVDLPNTRDETALMYLSILGETDRALKLIKAGAQVNRLGWTPLHYAASKAQIETATMLIQRGAIVNAPGPDGTTPLMMAAYTGKDAIVRLLLSHGADVTMINANHETAADWALKRNSTSMAAQLDDLAKRVTEKRQAQAGKPAGPAQETETSASVQTPQQKAEDQSSFSRYFDLDRFK